MTCTELREDIEAFVLGALEPAEARRVAAHLRECSECAPIARAYQLAVDQLALSVPYYRASSRLRDRIMGGIGAFRRPVYAGLARNRWLMAAAASLLIAFAIGGIAWAVVVSERVSSLREDNRQLAELTKLDAAQRQALLDLASELNKARTEQRRMSEVLDEQAKILLLALDPDLIPFELQGTGFAAAAHCKYVWSTSHDVGALTCNNLPTLSSALTYELWMTKGDQTFSLGEFVPRYDGSANMLVEYPEVEGPVTNLWVTLEQNGQFLRTKPSGDIALIRSPDQQAAR